jgi:Holliday junction resolvase RusA-like endonuclease
LGDEEELEEEMDKEEEGEEESPQSQGKTILDINVVPFEPVTTGSGQNIGEKEGRLKKAIMERLKPDELAELAKNRADRLVTLTVLFFLWKGSPKVTNTRPVKDLDNLLKIVLDVLKLGPQGLGIIEEDSYVCEVYSAKSLVDSEKEEGYRIIVEEFQDDAMLGVLKKFHAGAKK